MGRLRAVQRAGVWVRARAPFACFPGSVMLRQYFVVPTARESILVATGIVASVEFRASVSGRRSDWP